MDHDNIDWRLFADGVAKGTQKGVQLCWEQMMAKGYRLFDKGEKGGGKEGGKGDKGAKGKGLPDGATRLPAPFTPPRAATAAPIEITDVVVPKASVGVAIRGTAGGRGAAETSESTQGPKEAQPPKKARLVKVGGAKIPKQDEVRLVPAPGQGDGIGTIVVLPDEELEGGTSEDGEYFDHDHDPANRKIHKPGKVVAATSHKEPSRSAGSGRGPNHSHSLVQATKEKKKKGEKEKSHERKKKR